MGKLTTFLVHVLGLALVCVVSTYWLIRIATPAPTVAPAPLAPPPPRDPDPVLSARMFGKVQTAVEAAPSNVQVIGVFAAGRQSAAAISIDGKPARVFLLGQRVYNDLSLRSVDGEGVELGNENGVTQTVRVPKQASARFANQAPSPVYTMDHGVMTAPSVESAPGPLGGSTTFPNRAEMPRNPQMIQPQVNIAPPPQPQSSPPQQQLVMPGQPPPQQQ